MEQSSTSLFAYFNFAMQVSDGPQFGGLVYNRPTGGSAPELEPETLDRVVQGAVIEQINGTVLASYEPDGAESKYDTRRVQYARFKIAKDSVIRGTPLKRGERVKDNGVMMKSVGSSSTYGQFSENRGIIPPRKRRNEAKMAEELREEMKICMPREFSCCNASSQI